MAKEKTVLINLRVPNSLLREFDKEVTEDVLLASRTAQIIRGMADYIEKRKRLRRDSVQK